ncbi:MAG: hypothetical protein J5365_04345 [Erysipelotrichaceae bacterium]|nr:hypothetical protein [Erysipelotrichaceae bacterium]
MKKLLKGLLIVLIVLLLAAAGAVYYAYRKINNVNEYADRFVDYESELEEYADSKFEDFIFYDKVNYKFHYAVPLALLYRTINIDSMSEFLGLPENVTIKQIGIEPDTENKKVDIYLDLSYRNLIDTCLLIRTDYMVSEDRNCLEMRYDDYSIVNEYVTEKLREYVKSEKGDLMFTQSFPRYVEYYQMPTFRSDCITDVSYEDGCINAVYEIEKALIYFLEMNPGKDLKKQLGNDLGHKNWETIVRESIDLQWKLEAVDLQVRMKGIAH